VNPLANKKRKTTIITDSEAVSEDGIPTDVDVQTVADSGTTREGKTADIDEFFSATFDHTGTNGKVKKHRKCKICLYVCTLNVIFSHSLGCNRKHCVLVNESTTLRCHAEAHFAVRSPTFMFAFMVTIDILHRPSIESGLNQPRSNLCYLGTSRLVRRKPNVFSRLSTHT
jgi:hypothetical protein